MYFIIPDRPGYTNRNITTPILLPGIRAYGSPADRKRAIKALHKEYGYNHFTCFSDVHGKYALQYGKRPLSGPNLQPPWNNPNYIHVNW